MGSLRVSSIKSLNNLERCVIMCGIMQGKVSVVVLTCSSFIENGFGTKSNAVILESHKEKEMNM